MPQSAPPCPASSLEATVARAIDVWDCNRNVVAQAIVDDCDFEWLNQYRWHLNKGYVARTGPKKRTIRMHREVMQTPVGLLTDHINGNLLDNRRTNLRVCSPADNQHNSRKPRSNTSGFKGVYRGRNGNRWHARIGVNGETIHIGTFDSPEAAHAAYCAAADKHHGEFANHG